MFLEQHSRAGSGLGSRFCSLQSAAGIIRAAGVRHPAFFILLSAQQRGAVVWQAFFVAEESLTLRAPKGRDLPPERRRRLCVGNESKQKEALSLFFLRNLGSCSRLDADNFEIGHDDADMTKRHAARQHQQKLTDVADADAKKSLKKVPSIFPHNATALQAG